MGLWMMAVCSWKVTFVGKVNPAQFTDEEGDIIHLFWKAPLSLLEKEDGNEEEWKDRRAGLQEEWGNIMRFYLKLRYESAATQKEGYKLDRKQLYRIK